MTPGVLRRIRHVAPIVATMAVQSLGAAESAPAGFAIQVPAPGPGQFADRNLQDAIDKAAGQGRGVVELGGGEFKLSSHAGDETVILKGGVTLHGQGFSVEKRRVIRRTRRISPRGFRASSCTMFTAAKIRFGRGLSFEARKWKAGGLC